MDIDAIIFDLDGTLVDSSEGILASFAAAFRSCGQSPVRALSYDIIGPPLVPTLRMLSGTEEASVIEPLAEAFKVYYDEEGFRKTTAYAGVSAMLQRLAKDSRPVFIATNKRKRPSEAIIDWLQWKSLFQAVYALDSLQPAAPSKAALIRHILNVHKLPPGRTLYIGDRDEDAIAAADAGTSFYQAAWGYGQVCTSNVGGDLTELKALLQLDRSL